MMRTQSVFSNNQTKKYDNNLVSLDVELTGKLIHKLRLVPSQESHLDSNAVNNLSLIELSLTNSNKL